MKLAYQQCEVDWCRKQAQVMARDKRDYFLSVCKDCAKKLRKNQPKHTR
jgi:hypothetical protein